MLCLSQDVNIVLELCSTRCTQINSVLLFFCFVPQALGELLDDLVTMETLVYECGVGDTLTLAALREMSDYSRIELMMDMVC